MTDRIQYNEPGDWLGPDYAIGLVDEIVATNTIVHLEMMNDSGAYLGIHRDDAYMKVTIYARPTTRTERRQILAKNDDRLRDQLNGLLPNWAGGRHYWSIPWWQRAAAIIRHVREYRSAASAVLCVRIDENDLIPE